MANSRPLVVLAALALAACRPAASATFAGVTDAAHRGRAVLARYGIEGAQLRLPDAVVGARERASGVPLERALALAIEVLLADREDPESATALALAAGPASPCPRSSPVRAMACFMARHGSRLELAGPTAAPVIAREVDYLYLFALRVPELATTPFWVAIVAAPSGDLVAAPIRDRKAFRRALVDRELRSRARARSGTGVVTRGHHDRSAPAGRQ
jgi:hypothetical protein